MKNRTIFILAMLVIGLLTNTKANIFQGGSVTGEIKGLKNGSRILILIRKKDKTDTIALALSKNERFTFLNVKLPVSYELYSICIQTEFVKDLPLFLSQGEDITLAGVLESWPNIMVTGSKSHYDYLECKNLRNELRKKGFLLKYPDGMAEADTVTAYTLREYKEMITQRPESYYLAYAIANLVHPAAKYDYSFTPEMKRPLYELLSLAVKESYYVKVLAKQVGIEK